MYLPYHRGRREEQTVRVQFGLWLFLGFPSMTSIHSLLLDPLDPASSWRCSYFMVAAEFVTKSCPQLSSEENVFIIWFFGRHIWVSQRGSLFLQRKAADRLLWRIAAPPWNSYASGRKEVRVFWQLENASPENAEKSCRLLRQLERILGWMVFDLPK